MIQTWLKFLLTVGRPGRSLTYLTQGMLETISGSTHSIFPWLPAMKFGLHFVIMILLGMAKAGSWMTSAFGAAIQVMVISAVPSRITTFIWMDH